MSGPTWNGRAQIDIAQVEQILIDQQSALQKLQSGEVAALVRVVGKPVDFFNRIPRNSGLHLIPIPFTSRFAERLFSQWDQFLAPPRHPKLHPEALKNDCSCQTRPPLSIKVGGVRCIVFSVAFAAVVLISLLQIDIANAQAIPKSIQQGGSEYAIRERRNAWTVGIAGGLIDGTYMRFADELAKVLDDGDNLRRLCRLLHCW
jgi:hypothetical protein